jgi:hypothetical protein
MRYRLIITNQFIEIGGFWIKTYNRSDLLSINAAHGTKTMVAIFKFANQRTLTIESNQVRHRNFLKIFGLFPDYFPRTDKLHGGLLTKKDMDYIMEFSKSISGKQERM